MKLIITGGAGFIGSNAAHRYLTSGHHVVVIDNLARDGARKNLRWLESNANGTLDFVQHDIRDDRAMNRVFEAHRDAHRILHLAAQVAVTTSVVDPRGDFEVNALGTLNVLEAMRKVDHAAPVIFSSTNKVYGEMSDLSVILKNEHYTYADFPWGLSEERNLDFHSPYGCSKGAADQYVIDYHRIYGLKTIVFRQSCIYGYRQFGAEDQGWIAWFMIASLLGRPTTIYGDGMQTRDVLFIDDLLDAFDAGFATGQGAYGRAYNIGGGHANVLCLRDVIRYIEQRRGSPLPHGMADWRPGDQKVFVSDIRRAQAELGWAPRVNPSQGLHLLYDWIETNIHVFGDHASNLTPVSALQHV